MQGEVPEPWRTLSWWLELSFSLLSTWSSGSASAKWFLLATVIYLSFGHSFPLLGTVFLSFVISPDVAATPAITDSVLALCQAFALRVGCAA